MVTADGGLDVSLKVDSWIPSHGYAWWVNIKQSHLEVILARPRGKLTFSLTVSSIDNRLSQCCVDVIDPLLERET